MNDLMRESLSYFGLYRKMFQVKRKYKPEMVRFGKDKEQYFLYYEPDRLASGKIIVWVHGGGWNAGNPKLLGYRLSPKYKYPCQLRDVCTGYSSAVSCLEERGIDTSEIIVAGPSAGAHLASIMCYCRKAQKKYNVDITNIIGFIGSGGPYSFRDDQGLMLRLLEDQLFKKDYDRRNGEPVSLMSGNHIPMLLIQSRHDGLVEYACAEDFARKAEEVGNACELYSVTDRKNTHSWYTAGMFMETRKENRGLDKFFSWIEAR